MYACKHLRPSPSVTSKSQITRTTRSRVHLTVTIHVEYRSYIHLPLTFRPIRAGLGEYMAVVHIVETYAKRLKCGRNGYASAQADLIKN